MKIKRILAIIWLVLVMLVILGILIFYALQGNDAAIQVSIVFGVVIFFVLTIASIIEVAG